MQRTRWTTVLACFLAAAVLAWAATDLGLRYGSRVPSLTPWGAGVGLVIAAVVLVAGLAVRRLKAHEPTWITPTGAATTAVAAQASALVGSVVAGLYGGGLITALRAAPAPAMSSLERSSAVCLVASLVWCGVGLLVEHWCAIDASDDDDKRGGQSTSATPGAPA